MRAFIVATERRLGKSTAKIIAALQPFSVQTGGLSPERLLDAVSTGCLGAFAQ